MGFSGQGIQGAEDQGGRGKSIYEQVIQGANGLGGRGYRGQGIQQTGPKNKLFSECGTADQFLSDMVS